VGQPLSRRRVAGCAALLLISACVFPVRQFELTDRPLDCKQANRYAYFTLRSMGFSLNALEPATVDHPGAMHGIRKTETGTESATVAITCHKEGGADITASKDNSFLAQSEFKRGFYMSFTGVVSQTEGEAAAAQAEAARPFEEKQRKGLQVWLRPVPGLGSKLDFTLDLDAGGVLPVLVTVNNVTMRTYKMDPSEIVLIANDGTRVPPLALGDAAQRIVAAAGKQGKGDGAPTLAAVTRELESRRFTARSVPAKQRLSAYLYYPAAEYRKGRVVLEDAASEESEGFVVEF
jgi:hypothetical protein